jgi:predicted DNA-binding protein (UPF0251 family)
MVVGGVGLAVVAGVGGTAMAAGSSGPDSFLNDFAQHLGVSKSKVQSAYTQALQDQLNAMVKSGKLTQKQADEILNHAKENGSNPFQGPFGGGFPGRPGLGFKFGFHGHHHGFGGPMGGPMGGPFGQGLDTAAKYLGVSEATLRSDLQSGKSLADVAKSKGKSVSGLEAALLADAKTRLDKAVTDKHLTKQQETKILAGISKFIDAIVTHSFKHLDHPDGWGPPPSGNGDQAPSWGGQSAPTAGTVTPWAT